MAETALQIVLVTPETTLLDAPVRSLQFPLYDGQAGVLPGRAPVVGRRRTLGRALCSLPHRDFDPTYEQDAVGTAVTVLLTVMPSDMCNSRASSNHLKVRVRFG